jgi:hypothetical protein
MLASSERRRVAARIAIVSRHRGPDHPEVADLRRQLDALRVKDVAAWAAAAAAGTLDSAEVASAATLAARAGRDMDRAALAAESLAPGGGDRGA